MTGCLGYPVINGIRAFLGKMGLRIETFAQHRKPSSLVPLGQAMERNPSTVKIGVGSLALP